MQAASFTAGIIFFIVSTIARWIILKNSSIPQEIKRLFTVPAMGNREEIITAVGQAMGILWIGIGILLSQNEESFSSSFEGIIIEPLVVFTPFLLGGTIVKLLMSRNKNKGS